MSRYKCLYDMKLDEVPEPVLQLAMCLSCFSRDELGRWCRVPYCHGYYSTLLGMCSECEVIGPLGMKCSVIVDYDGRSHPCDGRHHPIDKRIRHVHGIGLIGYNDHATNRVFYQNRFDISWERSWPVRDQNQVQKELEIPKYTSDLNFDPRKEKGGKS